MYLYHYFEREFGPFRTPFASMSIEEAKQMLLARKAAGKTINPDIDGFLQRRYDRDKQLREAFIARGGKPQRDVPFYMMLGKLNRFWASAYEHPALIEIPMQEFGPMDASFTYGQSFAVLNPALSGPGEYWHKLYFADEILGVIERNGYPPRVKFDFKRKIFPKDKPMEHQLLFVEAHIWNDEVVGKYRDAWNHGKG